MTNAPRVRFGFRRASNEGAIEAVFGDSDTAFERAKSLSAQLSDDEVCVYRVIGSGDPRDCKRILIAMYVGGEFRKVDPGTEYGYYSPKKR